MSLEQKTFEELPPMDQRRIAKNVFASPDGQLFLGHLLYVLNFTAQLPRPMTADEIRTDILRLLGYFDPNNYRTVLAQIAGLDNLSLPAKIEKEKRENPGESHTEPQRGEQP